MTVYRIDRAIRSDPTESFSGKGGLFVAHRWNQLGTRIVYAASSLPLAALEILVNLPAPRDFPPHIYFRAEIPDHLIGNLTELPTNWSNFPGPPACQHLGSEWVANACTPALRVPSAILPPSEPGNVLLNPLHPEFDATWIQGPHPFTFDHRLHA